MTDVCLSCTLPICDETLPECAFVQITGRKSKLPEMQSIYNRRSYEKHAEKRRTAKRAYVAANKDKVKETQAAYRAKTDRREYFRERYRQSRQNAKRAATSL
jgi:hypothetical protein